MDSKPRERFRPDSAGTGFVPDQPIDDLVYRPLRCECGGDVFRVTGWPRAVSGPGGFFWRSLTRVWREARQMTSDGNPIEEPFEWPIQTECRACGRRDERLDDPRRFDGGSSSGEGRFGGTPKADRSGSPPRSAPREAYRCRDCRRGQVELMVGTAASSPGSANVDSKGVDLVARCVSCRHQSRIAASARRPTDQQVRLDLLYGRR